MELSNEAMQEFRMLVEGIRKDRAAVERGFSEGNEQAVDSAYNMLAHYNSRLASWALDNHDALQAWWAKQEVGE